MKTLRNLIAHAANLAVVEGPRMLLGEKICGPSPQRDLSGWTEPPNLADAQYWFSPIYTTNANLLSSNHMTSDSPASVV